MAGLDSSGFTKKTAEEILTEMITEARAAFGDSFAENSDTPEYIDLSLKADSLADIWEQAEAVYYSGFRDTAEDVNLDYVCGNIGVQRIAARRSIVRGVTLTNDTASPAVIPAGSLARQSSTLREWETLEEVTIPATDTITVDMQCVDFGQITAPIGSIDTIVNPILGWDDVNNTADVINDDLGREEETDSQLRIRAASSLIQSTGGVVSAIANRVLEEVEGVDYTSWRENRTDSTDGNGLPPHSFEIIVDGGDSGDIAQVILDNKAGGIETYGSESEIVNDSEGNPTTINFSRITQVELYFIVNLVTNSDYPVDGDDTVKSLLAEYINSLDRNEDVLNWKLDGSFIDVEGITGVTSILMGTVDPPVSSANISIGANERAVTEVANITVNS